MNDFPVIRPNWPAPQGVRALTTTRQGGVSKPPFDSLNLGAHVQDDPGVVTANRRLLREQCRLPSEPLWLRQVHGVTVVDVGQASPGSDADAGFTDQPGRVCAIMTADCLPVLFCDRAGHWVAAAHAGWRGLAGGILTGVVRKAPCPPEQLLVWLGPAIGPDAFEVGDDVRQAFIGRSSAFDSGFRPGARSGKWLADIYGLARVELNGCGVQAIYGGDYCTYSQESLFFSYRRNGPESGRLASLIWLEK